MDLRAFEIDTEPLTFISHYSIVITYCVLTQESLTKWNELSHIMAKAWDAFTNQEFIPLTS